jgi:hypothetical protein
VKASRSGHLYALKLLIQIRVINREAFTIGAFLCLHSHFYHHMINHEVITIINHVMINHHMMYHMMIHIRNMIIFHILITNYNSFAEISLINHNGKSIRFKNQDY